MVDHVVMRWVRQGGQSCPACGAALDRLEPVDEAGADQPGTEPYTTGVAGTLRCSDEACATRALGGP